MPKQIGIDLGTSITMIAVKDKEKIAMRAPTVVGLDKVTREVLASGARAKKMLGKTPADIRALRPLKNGVITDVQTTSLMLHDFFIKLDLASFFNRPSALVTIPYEVTDVERRAVEDAVFEAGARNVGLIDVPIAAAVGAGIRVSNARGAMLVDLGGGISEASVISLGGIVKSTSLRTAGDSLDQAIVGYLKRVHHIHIGEISAERLKLRLGSADPTLDRGTMPVSGLDSRTHTAVTREIRTADIYEAIKEPIGEIVTMVKRTFEETPPELSADIFETGIVMVGGGSLLPGLAELIAEHTGVRVTVAPHPMECACIGLGRMLRTTGGDFSEFIRYKVK